MPKLLIKNGRVIDPASKHDAVADVLLEDGLVAAVGQNLSAPGAQLFDASGLIVAPGFIDMHVHLREPGFEHAETIESGSRRRSGWRLYVRLPDGEHQAGERQRDGHQLHRGEGATARHRKRVSDRRDHQGQQWRRARGHLFDARRGCGRDLGRRQTGDECARDAPGDGTGPQLRDPCHQSLRRPAPQRGRRHARGRRRACGADCAAFPAAPKT